MAYSIDYINQICIDLGGTGGHKYDIDALNEICGLLGATAGHDYEIDALNAICTAMGYTAGWKYEIEALNTIVVGGTYKYEVEAWADIQVGSKLNLFDALAPSSLTATVVSNTEITVAFTVNSTNGEGTRIYISTDNVNFTEKGTVSGSTATYSATGLSQNTTYYFYAKAYYGANESDASNTGSEVTFNTELITYITGLTTPLSDGHKNNLDTLIRNLKSGLSISNLSDLFDFIYVFAGETSESSLKNLVANSSHATLGNSPTFTQFQGFEGDPTQSRYINSNYNPFGFPGNYKQDDASFGIYLRNDIAYATNGTYFGSILSAGTIGMNPYRTATSAFVWINQDQSSYTSFNPSSESKGWTIGVREASTVIKVYRNKSLKVTDNKSSSSSIPNATLKLLLGGSYSGHQIGIAFLGKKLTQTLVDNLIDAFQTYISAVSVFVLMLTTVLNFDTLL